MPPKFDGFSRSEHPQDWQSEDGDFSAPHGTVKSGRLVFASGAGQVSLKVSRRMSDLYRARFKRPGPTVLLREGDLTIQYQGFPFLDRPVYLGEPFAEIILNGSIPWEIEFRNGISALKADLGELQLRSLDILGGASQVELVLSKPAGTTFIYISGGIRKGAIRRPLGVGVRVQVNGGASKLVLDDQHLSAIGGETSLESSDFNSAASRYDICIAGGASQVVIVQET